MTTRSTNTKDSISPDVLASLAPLVSTKELLSVARTLLRRDSDELDGLFADRNAMSLLLTATSQLCRDGFQTGDIPSQLAAQRMLNDIYKLFLRPPDEARSAQGSAVVAAIKGEIERHLIAAEDSRIQPEVFESIPLDGDEFVPFLERLISSHAAYQHPLYAQVLRHEADVQGLRTFFIQEISVDGSFSDFLALLLVGTGGSIRMEISKNYWDEMGNGKPAEVHTDLFMRAVRALGLGETELEEKASLESLYCGNLSLCLALNRKYFSAALGYFAAMEYLVPHRFEHVLTAWERNGLRAEDIEYHRLHIAIDVTHSRGWLDNVIKPLVAGDPRKALDVTRGVLYRLNSSVRYLDALTPMLKADSKT
jgi:pyrroloquinoline quinone (PQQ) biosynthesis protein C